MPGEGVVRGGRRVVAHLGPGPRVVSVCGPGPGPSPASWGQRPMPSVKGRVAVGVTDARGALDPRKESRTARAWQWGSLGGGRQGGRPTPAGLSQGPGGLHTFT